MNNHYKLNNIASNVSDLCEVAEKVIFDKKSLIDKFFFLKKKN